MFGNTFSVEFVGGSRDGDIIRARVAPDYFEVKSAEGWIEVYERQNDQPPFVYVQIGYAKHEQWH